MLEYHTQSHYTTYVDFTYTWNQDLLQFLDNVNVFIEEVLISHFSERNVLEKRGTW